MKTCPRCLHTFEDDPAYCSVCGASLTMPTAVPVAPAAPTKPPSLVKAIVGLVLSASGLECAIATIIIQLYFSLFAWLFGFIGFIDPAEAGEMLTAGGVVSGFSLYMVLAVGGFALAFALVGRHLTNQSAAAGNRSRMISISRVLARVAIILTIVAAAMAVVQLLVMVISATM